jgi:hypothetical protein
MLQTGEREGYIHNKRGKVFGRENNSIEEDITRILPDE